MHIVTIVGARPQFVKAAVVSHALQQSGLAEVLVHTGQHYDPQMSQVFFDELGIPEPAVNLGVGSGPHGAQTGEMMRALEQYLLDHPMPDGVLVYGDTNSTMAGALVAAKLHLPLAHVEAGLRSFNRRMPEEINRVVTDHVSNLLFCPTDTAVENLRREGITQGVEQTGDVMLDATRFYAERAAAQAPLSRLTTHAPGTYHLATVHRAENTDDPVRLWQIFEAFARLEAPVLLPLHPRTRHRLADGLVPKNVELRPPASYLEMLTLTRHARRVLTDSGGLQKEAVWLGTPCLTLRAETEWIETQASGWNQVVGTDPERIVAAARQEPTAPFDPGQPQAAARIARLLATFRAAP
jgi:UDP-GlcNAc3NAcA epimerase